MRGSSAVGPGGYPYELLTETEALANPYEESGNEESDFLALRPGISDAVCEGAARRMKHRRGILASGNSCVLPTVYPQPRRPPLNCRLRLLRPFAAMSGRSAVAADFPAVYFSFAFGLTGASVKASYLQGLSEGSSNQHLVVLKRDLYSQEGLAAKAWAGLPNTGYRPGASAA